MLRFDEENHRYFDGEIELPSVTTITRFCNYDSRTAAGTDPFYRDRGTLIHELCADYDFTDELPTGTGIDGYLKAYADFVRDYRPKWGCIEYMIGNAEIGFAGTVDRIGKIDGKLVILDIKSSSKVNKTALTAQLTGYSLLCNDVPLFEEVQALYGLQLQKKGTYRLIPIEPDLELWESCRVIHQKGLKK